MKCFKMFGLLFASLAMLAMVGCGGGGGGSSHNTNPNTTVGVLIPLPTGGSSMRTSMRAVSAENFKAYYLNSAGKTVPATSISGLNTATATVAFTDVPPGSDLVIKSELNNGKGFKPYYQGLVKKSELVGNGAQVGKKLDSETTAKAMLFEEKQKTETTLSVADFEYTLNQEKETSGKDVFAILGVTSNDMEKSLTDLTVEDLSKKVIDAAKEIEIQKEPEPTPQPTPTTGYVDETNKKLAEYKDWKTSDERTIYQLLTTGRSEPGQMLVYDEEKDEDVWVDVAPIADGGMAAEIIYSTKDGVNWTAPTDKPIIIYEEMGGSHPYCLYRNNKWVGPAQQFHYKKATKLFRYVYYNHEKSLKEPVEKGLEYYELLDSRYFKVEEVTLDNVTYYRATNNDNAKDIYLFKLIKRPADLGKVNPSDEVIQLDKLMNATWKQATEAEIQDLIGYKNVRASKVIYRYNGNKWETPTNVLLTYAVIPNAYHPWHIYVNGNHADGPGAQVNENVWYFNNMEVDENFTIDGAYAFLTTKIDGVDYIKMKNTEKDDVMTSIFMKVDGLPATIEEDINKMIESMSSSSNVRK